MRARSLTRRIVIGLLGFQVIASLGAASAATLVYWRLGGETSAAPYFAAEAIAKAIDVEAGRDMTLTPSDAMQSYADRSASFWFIATHGRQRLAHGAPPPGVMADLLDKLPPSTSVLDAVLEDANGSIAARSFETSSGPLFVVTGGLPFRWADIAVVVFYLVQELALWLVLPLMIGTAILVPWLASSVLRQVRCVADTAALVNPDNRGQRLPLENTPLELAPLVRATNAAFARLDLGYERQRRFIADAAHELRTPIAILRTRLDALDDGPLKERLLLDARRLSSLADQLLELERVRHGANDKSAVNLVELTRSIATDLAARAIDAGYEIAFEAETETVTVLGEDAALRRAVVNLVENAIQHGGGAGVIQIKVYSRGVVEVCDAGPGVPPDLRARLFEPFFRGARSGPGAGLGLHLVREIARAHGGGAQLVDRPGRGACFQLVLGTPDDRQFQFEGRPRLKAAGA